MERQGFDFCQVKQTVFHNSVAISLFFCESSTSLSIKGSASVYILFAKTKINLISFDYRKKRIEIDSDGRFEEA